MARRPLATLLLLLAASVALAACGDGSDRLVLRGVDELQVADPDEVAAARPQLARTSVDGDQVAAAPAPSSDAAPTPPPPSSPDDTIPLTEDDRSAGEKMFEAYEEFSACLEDEGQAFQGDPRNDPNLQNDSGYMDALIKCAARSNIAEVAAEYQSAQENLSSDEIREQNERFVELEDCLLDRGWDIETSTNKDGLITPSVFVSPNGEIDARDIEQCAAERNLDIDG